MGKNRSINSVKTKDVVKYLYLFAKRKNYLNDIIRIAGVTTERSLQWSYQQGKISEEQIAAYVQALGVDRDFLTGEKDMTSADKDLLEHTLPNRATDVPSIEMPENFNLINSYCELIENAEVRDLANIKLNIQILLKKVEIREIESQIS